MARKETDIQIGGRFWSTTVDGKIVDEGKSEITKDYDDLARREYEALGESVKTVRLIENKSSIKCLLVKSGLENEIITSLNNYKLELPKISTEEMRQKVSELGDKIKSIDEKIISYIKLQQKLMKQISIME